MARIYFAHPVTVFDTKLEKQMRNRILASFLGAEIEDPNQPHHQQGYAEWKKKLEGNPSKEGGMSYYYDVVLPTCDLCVSMPFRDGKLGAGVAGEAEFFIKKGKDSFVFTIPGLTHIRLMTPEERNLIVAHDPSFVLCIEETRARTWTSPQDYNRVKRPYETAHLGAFVFEEWTAERLKRQK